MNATASPGADAIRLSAQDNVATVLRPVAAGERLRVGCGRDIVAVEARQPIPLCHKISLGDLPAGVPVVKYGHPIGVTTAPVAAGDHVHVHNMRSARGGPAGVKGGA
jgi:altronate dehydratase small subunit